MAESAIGCLPGDARHQALVGALSKIDSALEGRAASEQEAQRRVDELGAEMSRNSGSGKVQEQYKALQDAMKRLESDAEKTLLSHRIHQHLRTRMNETRLGPGAFTLAPAPVLSSPDRTTSRPGVFRSIIDNIKGSKATKSPVNPSRYGSPSSALPLPARAPFSATSVTP